jgi:hypothetical protein
MKNFIYVLRSFKMKNEIDETGRLFWFPSLKDVLEYIDKAGQLTEDGSYWDEPCELAFNFVVVEKVSAGPISFNEVVGWWAADYSEGFKLTKIDPPVWTKNIFNFTGVG